MNNSSNASATTEKTYLFSNRDLRELMIPLVMEQFLAVLVGMVSSILVANVGEAAVSGVSLIDNIIVLLIQIFAALATGGAVVAGQYLGQKKHHPGPQCNPAIDVVYRCDFHRCHGGGLPGQTLYPLSNVLSYYR